MNLTGLDGCKQGAWVAARPGPSFEIITDLRLLLEQAAQGQLRVVLDVPIGLIPSGRRCDAEARKAIGKRRSSVFSPPCRAGLVATCREQASSLNYAATGKKIGAQAFGILSRIAAVDRLMTPELQSQVHEGHPEVSFAVAAGKHPRFNKKCPDGEQERLSILAQHDFRFDPEAERRRLGPSWLERDEIIDAGVMLWTAVRVQAGDARRLPNGLKERDHRGLLAEIWLERKHPVGGHGVVRGS